MPNAPLRTEHLALQRPVYLVEGGHAVAVLAYEATNFASITPASILLYRATPGHQPSLVQALYTADPAVLPPGVRALATPATIVPRPDQPLALPPSPVSSSWIAHNGTTVRICLYGAYGRAPFVAAEHAAYFVIQLRWQGSGFAVDRQSIEVPKLVRHHNAPPTTAPPSACSQPSA